MTIASSFHGPEGSGTGATRAGLVAGFVGDRAQVTLHAPPPLERSLTVRRRDQGVGLWDGDTLVADARPWPQPVEAPPAGDIGTAARFATDPAAILDCPSGWATMLLFPLGTASVLGRFTGVVYDRPAPGTACVVVSQPDHRHGRKAYASAGLYSAEGRLLVLS